MTNKKLDWQGWVGGWDFCGGRLTVISVAQSTKIIIEKKGIKTPLSLKYYPDARPYNKIQSKKDEICVSNFIPPSNGDILGH